MAFTLLLVGAAVVLPTQPASAIPSFARQTGQPCASCHSAFPQLTPFGRRFKLNGYTLGGTRCGSSQTSETGGTKAAPSPMRVGAENAAVAAVAAAAAAADNKAAAGSSDPSEVQIPISGMAVPGFTHIQKGLATEDTPQGFNSNNNVFFQETKRILRRPNLLQLWGVRTRHLRAPWQQLLSGQHRYSLCQQD